MTHRKLSGAAGSYATLLRLNVHVTAHNYCLYTWACSMGTSASFEGNGLNAISRKYNYLFVLAMSIGTNYPIWKLLHAHTQHIIVYWTQFYITIFIGVSISFSVQQMESRCEKRSKNRKHFINLPCIHGTHACLCLCSEYFYRLSIVIFGKTICASSRYFAFTLLIDLSTTFQCINLPNITIVSNVVLQTPYDAYCTEIYLTLVLSIYIRCVQLMEKRAVDELQLSGEAINYYLQPEDRIEIN